jgi:transposase
MTRNGRVATIEWEASCRESGLLERIFPHQSGWYPKEWKAEYVVRAGVEGTLSQGVRGFGLRRCRYVGLAKARLQHVATAAAINVYQISDWVGGIPRAATRTSRFARLAA